MEKSLKKSSSVEIPKRKSLDLKSLYSSRVSNVGVSKKQVSEENDNGDVKKKKRKGESEGSLSCLESDTKKIRKKCVDGAKSEPSSIESSGGSELLHGISFSFGKNETSFNIPKRPRGLVGRKRLKSSQVSEPLELSNSDDHVGTFNADAINEADPNDQLVRFVSHPAVKDGSSSSKSAGDASGSKCKLKQKADSKHIGTVSSSDPKLKEKGGADEVKQSRSRTDRSSSVLHAEKEDNPVVNNEGTSSKKRQSNSRKNKDLVAGGHGSKSSTKKSEPAVGGTKPDCVPLLDVDDDDEENLEQNAARMLSSRFDPSCTGFSTKNNSSVPQTANGFSNPISPVRDSFNQQNNSSVAVESTSVDKSRELRPKGEDKDKGVPRKRRHFYEILPKDLDACWLLNRRIKVFWPLDESWYHGLVNDYHPECKVHHIKYDDRDEEWVDLNEEKFKLLLFADEVPGKRQPKKKSGNKDVHEGKDAPLSDDDSNSGNCLDSEPLASWLARSSRRLKPLPKSLKKQRTSQVHLPVGSLLPSEKADNLNIELSDSKRTSTKPECKSDQSLVHLHEGSSLSSEKFVSNPKFAGFKRSRNEPDCQSVTANKILVQGMHDQSLLRITSSFQNGKHVVYVRKKSSGQCKTSSSMPGVVKSHGKVAVPVTVGPATGSLPTTEEDKFDDECLDFYKKLCLIDDEDTLKLDIVLLPKECRLQLCLPLLPFLELSFGTGYFWLPHYILMPQYGSLVTTSPAVILEFIDGNLGLRFLLFEGCLKQALAFVFLILIVFSQPDEQQNNDMQLPVTSIRFRFSSAQDLKKQHTFAIYSYSTLQNSKWRYLNSKLIQHCRLINQLPVSECTYDSIKRLECGNSKQCKPRVGLKLSSSEGCEKIFVPVISPMDLSRKSCNTRTRLSAYSQDANPRTVPQFGLSFSEVPTFFPSSYTSAQVNLQQSNSLNSPEWLNNGSTKVGEKHTLFQPRSINVKDIIAEDKIEMGTEASALTGLLSCEQGLGTDLVLASDDVEKVDSSENLQKRNLDGAGSAVSLKEFKENTREVIAQPLQGKGVMSRQTSDVGCIENDGFVHSPNPTGSISSRQCSSSLISSRFADFSSLSHDGKTNFMQNGFSNGPKKPRTQVQYTLPYSGYELNTKQKIQNYGALPCKRIRRASLRKFDGSKDKEKNLELLACGANVLITHGDKGWREYGAHIFLEVADHNEWRLAVKLLGITKYSYKVKHVLQPGSTNRYSHAMMWKGGNDWVLEFPDRSQWTLFKEMHEECYNRNIRAASVKHIPIPGVWLVEERNDCGTEVPFVRSSTKYFRQVQNDVEMAMDPSRVLYDLDTDDEQWLKENNDTDKLQCETISDEFLEKMIDMFEKVSYVRHRDNFTDAEIEELVIGVGSLEAAKVVYDYWQQKRERKGVTLIRHLQPPLWDRFQQQMKKWELTVARGNVACSVTPSGKQPMFAFCLKPRGLDVPNKGSKQRSHRKFSVSGQHHATSRHQDSPLGFGRRSNGHAFGDEKVHGTSDVSPSPQASMRVLSPPDEPVLSNTNVSERNRRNSKAHKHKPTKPESQPSFNNQQMVSHNQGTIGNRNGVQQRNTGLPVSDFHVLRLRDASRAAQHALKMAKLKREKAQKLFSKADLAIHQAVVALMTAEAIKAVDESSNGVN